ncbi:DUF4091 domain-containing protein [Chitinophagaceae bacterium 26-R-25]|nr:DUF4091 domain-containing protein [Chitinophagaceae bacterium 26-R-25]
MKVKVLAGVILFCICCMQLSFAQSMQGSFENKFARYQKNQNFAGTSTANWTDTAWKGDRLYKQIVLWNTSPTNISNITYEVSNLVSGGNTIVSSNVNLRYESYVIGDTAAHSWRLPYSTTGNRSRTYIADALQPAPITTLTQADPIKIWLKLDVPSSTVAGAYTGTVTVKSNGIVQKTFNINLLVVNNTLPPVSNWSYNLNIWQFPFNLNNIESQAAGGNWDFFYYFSDSYFAKLRSYYQLLLDMGQKNITTYGYDGAFLQGLTTIKWKLNNNGTFNFSFDNFDKYVDSLTSWGFTGDVDCFVMDGWKYPYTLQGHQTVTINSIGYYNNLTDINPNFKNRVQNQTTYPSFHATWANFLAQFRAHLNQKGWFNRVVLCFDETNTDTLKGVYLPLIKGDTAAWKVSHTGRWIDDSVVTSLYNYSMVFSNSKNRNPVSPQHAYNFYTSNDDSIPNNFLTPQNNPAEMAWLAWYAKNKQFNGYIRWAYDNWKNADTTNMQDDASTAGDCEFVYRSNNQSTTTAISSIRLELLRDGIQDFEKMRIIGGSDTALNNLVNLCNENSGTIAQSLIQSGQSDIKRIAANNTFGPSAIRLDTLLMPADQPITNTITIYPNPVHATLKINAHRQVINSIAVFATNGERMNVTLLNGHDVDCSNLVPGQYILVVNNSQSFKFLKQ